MSHRIILPANNINNPFANELPSRCKKSDRKKCLLLEEVFDEKKSCSYCVGLKNVWMIRKRLLEHVPDIEIEKLDVYDFEDKYPRLYKQLKKFATEHKFPDASKLYDDIRQFGSYKDTDPIRIDNNIVINGRHRCRTAQLLNIEVPVRIV